MAFRKAVKGTAVIGGGAIATVFGLSQFSQHRNKHGALVQVQAEEAVPVRKEHLPTREQQLVALQSCEEFDVLIIGGGATGCGCALDAATRGLKTALLERDDFSSGTSSRSTKLIHGGVRYLQKAIMKLDLEQYRMVKEALEERAHLLQSAPHLSAALPIMLPIYKWWQLPYYWIGIKLYDLVAGSQCLKSSYVLTKARALELFPMLRRDKLVGAIVYYDGEWPLCLLCPWALGLGWKHKWEPGDCTLGLCSLKDSACLLVSLGDKSFSFAGKEFDVMAKCVINATGPFTDSVRKMDDQEVPNICQPSAGVHIVMPGYYSPDNMGLLDPDTSDGRVIFFLPWEKMTIAGTTDSPTDVTAHPIPTEEDVNFILSEVRNYLGPAVEVRRGDVLAAWSGIRPLVTNPDSKDTQSLSRNHVVTISDSGLITIAGGKWTTYRAMARDTIDAAVREHSLQAGSCRTMGLQLEGAKDWSPTLYIRLVQDYGLESEVAQHLATTYGDKAFEVAKIAQVTGKRWPVVGKRLVSEFPYIEAEVVYGVKEYARTAVDIISRRTRLAFLNVQAAEEALPRIVDIMAKELNWCEQKKKEQLETAKTFLYYEMGYKVKTDQLTDSSEISLAPSDIERYKKRFHMFDKDKKGFITILDVQRVLRSVSMQIDENTLHEILNEVDLNKNGQVELNEFLQLMSAIQKGRVSGSRLAVLMKSAEENLRRRQAIPVDRSGGGL
ncbi:glycerol-3-phosphate dehydrogenase, mitochondrial [Serinus canaria]|uniref:glycerol-3-phosphate dehydrogenase, mitochondrial n=1 Tax=Serinus canaria TaxID=9135 RepID=UPI0021CCD46E|nr:glycerol-3-phosphate dehydrogenase, mitochondrial [Serinus canaria]